MKRITKYKNNKTFNTTLINVVYQFKCKNSEIMAYTILCRLLAKTNNKYNTEASFLKERLNRYIINYSVSQQAINKVYFINFSLLIPNSNIIKSSRLEDQILFLLDSIYDNNLSNTDQFLKEKKLYTESLLNNYKNIEFIAEKRVLDILDSNGIFNKFKYKDIENINKLELNDIISFFNKYIRNIKPSIFINGNIDYITIDNIIDRYLNNTNLKKKNIIKNYNEFYSSTNSNNLVIDKSKFYQSIVYLVYKVDNYKENDFYKLFLINLLLSNSSSNLLINSLRKKSNLVYTTNSSILIRNGLLFIKSLTNNNNVRLVKKIINELILDLKNIDKYKDNINNIIKNLEINIEREKDNFYIVSNNIINDYFKSDITSNDELKILKSIKGDELIEFIGRLNIICDYTLEGEL